MKKKKAVILATVVAVIITLFVPALTYASSEDVAAVIAAIDALPAYEDLSAAHADSVEAVWEDYSKLTTAEKINVTNADKLIKEREKLLRDGILTDTEKLDAEEERLLKEKQAKEEISGQTASQVTDYTFLFTSDSPVSIVIRYTTDADKDGAGDAPNRVTLTSPQAETFPVTSKTAKLTDDGLTVGITWEDNFAQLDFATAAEGKWTISTSIPCTFSSIDYAGAREDIASISEQNPKDESSEAIDAKPNEDNSGSSFPILKLLLVVIVFGGAFAAFYKKFLPGKAGSGKPNQEKKQSQEELYDEEIVEISDEEIIEQMRAEFSDQLEQDYNDEELLEESDYQNLGNDVEPGLANPEQEGDETIEEYIEGDTGLLSGNGRKNAAEITGSFFEEDDDDF